MTLSPIPRFTPLFARPILLMVTLLFAFALLGLRLRPVQAAGVIYYVATSGSDSNAGTSWATAKQHVQSGINASNPGDQIWVEQGTYTENITLKTSTKLYGGFAGTETMLSQRNFTTNVTTIDGNQAGTVVTVPTTASTTTVLDGFTIQNGKNTGGNGGGIYCPSSPTISNCIITKNVAYSAGGGIYLAGTLNLTNCTITQNQAFDSFEFVYGDGGGLYLAAGQCNISNSTITSNTASLGGGVYVYNN